MINLELIILLITAVILIILKFRLEKTTFLIILILTLTFYIGYYGYVFYTYLKTSNFNLQEAIKMLIEKNKTIIVGIFLIWLVSSTISDSVGGEK